MDGYMNFIVYTNRNSFVNMSEHFKMNKVIKLKHSRLPRPHTIKTGAIGFFLASGVKYVMPESSREKLYNANVCPKLTSAFCHLQKHQEGVGLGGGFGQAQGPGGPAELQRRCSGHRPGGETKSGGGSEGPEGPAG